MDDSPQSTLPLVLSLASAEATLENVGGKGASLARLAAAGLPVPPGFHITTAAYDRFVAANSLQAAIMEAVGGASVREPASLESAERRIQALFDAAEVPSDIAQAIGRAYADLAPCDGAAAVRSSATAEDLPGMSFAGQQESFLNVRGEAEVLSAVKRCWASLWSARAIGYRAGYGIAPEAVSIAVVVQQLVPAEAAGILFTANPLSGDRDQVMINAAWGLGPAVVGGLVTPDTIVADKVTGAVLQQQVADKAVMSVLTEGGTAESAVPNANRWAPVLGEAQVADLVRAAVSVEVLYGQPMDVEWAVHDGQTVLLQARPITALPEAKSGSALDWQLPDPKGRYARSSAIELMPDPLSPLFATLALPEWGTTMAMELGRLFKLEGTVNVDELVDAGHRVFTTINDYAYYDIDFLTKWMSKLAPALPRILWGLGPLLGSSEKRWAEEARPAYAALVAEWEARDLAHLPAVELLRGAKALVVAAARHYLSVQTGILPAAYMTEALFTSIYERTVRRRGDPPALTFVLGFSSTPIRAEQSLYDLARWARGHAQLRDYLSQTPGAAIAAALSAPEDELAEAGEAWPEFRRRFRAHLAAYGAAIYDLDFAKATPADDPAPLLETVKFFLGDEAPNPHERQARSSAERERASRAALSRLRGPRLGVFRRTLELAQRYAPLREDSLADAGLGWPVLRRMVVEVGRRLLEAGSLAAPEDVFWLRYDELQADAESLDSSRPTTDHRATVDQRRARWTEEKRLTPPVALPLKDGMRFMGFDWSSYAPARTDQAHGSVIKGLGTSPGRVVGTARVIQGPEEFTQMRPGDILVARITTPAWTPLFALAAGVVTDVGGALSHSSIVAREYGIPAVLGTGVATERIHSGQRIVVDGDAGTVVMQGLRGADLLEEVPAAPASESAGRRRLPAVLGLSLAALLAVVWFRRRKAKKAEG